MGEVLPNQTSRRAMVARTGRKLTETFQVLPVLAPLAVAGGLIDAGATALHNNRQISRATALEALKNGTLTVASAEMLLFLAACANSANENQTHHSEMTHETLDDFYTLLHDALISDNLFGLPINLPDVTNIAPVGQPTIKTVYPSLAKSGDTEVNPRFAHPTEIEVQKYTAVSTDTTDQRIWQTELYTLIKARNSAGHITVGNTGIRESFARFTRI